MKMILIFICLFSFLFSSLAMASIQGVKKFDWDGIEVTWLQDERFPVFNVIFYFADGSLSDNSTVHGETSVMFNMLKYGTRRYVQKEISGFLDDLGISTSAYVTHEWSSYAFSGLISEIVPATKLVCHLFHDAIFPKVELKKGKRRMKNSMRNLINSHEGLVSRIFREVSLKGTPYWYPVGGKLKDINKINQKGLKSKLKYFNNKVAKRIYISGPAKVLSLKKIIMDECGWLNENSGFTREVVYKKNSGKKSKRLFLVPVPKANQARVMIGRFLDHTELGNSELMRLSSGFLGGGGFSSKLMQEVRVKRGLTYGISSFAARQKNYGRAGISTFTKNESLKELLSVVKNTINDVGQGNFKGAELERARGLLSGSYPFRFEKNGAYLEQLLYMDHIGKSYDDLYRFPEIIKKFGKMEVSKKISDIFNWKLQTIVVLGNKTLRSQMKEFGNVTILNYRDFL